ncbi:hypothetical protein [Streptomyces sp. 11-1-2]|uniref:hypothetical protein n=1 Tax=unclassified Streptomyces TaxID=2593676 RepID=UPI00196909D6|nr:hypothetical protein [Streptomyces sp. 11-1-2]
MPFSSVLLRAKTPAIADPGKVKTLSGRSQSKRRVIEALWPATSAIRGRHPKSLVALDRANHLLTNPADTRYVATVLAVWAGRYVLSPAPLGERTNRD